MYKKRYPPLIVSFLLLIIGIIGFIFIYNYWNVQQISVTDPLIEKVNVDTEQLDLKSIIYEAEKNVIQIEGKNDHTTITGSGFLYNEKGDIITNAHVINDAEMIYVRTANARIYPAAVVGIGEENDIAVIRVPQLAGQDFSPVEDDSFAEIGDEVIALGSPHGFQNTVTLGIISGTERNFTVDGYDYSNVYQISAPITHGNSGGPLINRNTGKIIGINSVGTNDGTIGFSIPTNDVMDQIEQWSYEAHNDQLDFANIEDITDTENPENYIDDAEYLIDYYLESISNRDYVSAYALLGSIIQAEYSYPDFREAYIHTVDLHYEEFSSNVTDDNYIKITTDITTESNNGEESNNETSTFEFTIGYENDQLKILTITTNEKDS
ncbi:hypothetical protein J2Z83_000365 [Virgibacillus natechei]|uniref:Trypsin-like serine protease n=1 Tax=Virgibacillus natechei TaxID=1216297 RepID=A0ABS4IBP2_9BACI|nr:trypsin-like peptidase domain-containing protein [Virgibacillus natechei]MBP1968273.1 hypothetical protein [Virgibacillus natechei]UZD14461.1 S1C family serine protease [Virgibacillus natechei]